MNKKIIFCGGGTLGPVTPLLAIIEAWQRKDSSVKFVFVGTPHGPERELMEKEGIKFYSLPVAKLVRYPSLDWLWLPFRFVAAKWVAWSILKKEKPNLIISAGGFTAVPLILVGWFLKIPAWIHQQDVRPILSNKITAPFAKLITVAWSKSLKDFPKAKLIGNPSRLSFLKTSKEEAIGFFSLNKNKPTVLILGGGTGSVWLNERAAEISDELINLANVIHLTGKGKMIEHLKHLGGDYKVFELLTEEMPLAFAAADLVVCRAGMGTITELAATKKAAIIIPLPNSPQEDNVEVLRDAAIILEQEKTSSVDLLIKIKSLLSNKQEMKNLGENLGKVLKTDVALEMVGLGERVER